MEHRVEPKDLANAILDGMKESQQQYEKMSGGRWLDDAPEYFLTSQLAVRLNEELKLSCALEEPMVNFPLGRGAPGHRLRRNGRADIALWNPDEQVAAIVEVKNSVYHENCVDDLHRLAVFSSRVAGRPITAFAYFQTVWGLNEETCRAFSATAEHNLRTTIESTVHDYQLQIEHHGFASEPEQYDDDRFYGYLAHASTFRVIV